MAKIIQHRNKCIGCGVCMEMQPTLWRMSKKDGKAILLGASEKKGLFIKSVSVDPIAMQRTMEACPVRIIQTVY